MQVGVGKKLERKVRMHVLFVAWNKWSMVADRFANTAYSILFTLMMQHKHHHTIHMGSKRQCNKNRYNGFVERLNFENETNDLRKLHMC